MVAVPGSVPYTYAMRVIFIAAALAVFLPAQSYESVWAGENDRTWVGPGLWANRLQDWRVSGGHLECLPDDPGLPYRTVHLLSHRVKPGAGFTTEVELSLQGDPVGTSPACAGGILVGVGGAGMDWRAAALVHQWPGPGQGVLCGVDRDGRVFFRDLRQPQALPQRGPGGVPDVAGKPLALRLVATPDGAGSVRLELSATVVGTPDPISTLALRVREVRCAGGLALVSHPGDRDGDLRPGRWRFRSWRVSGDDVDHDPARTFGPIACAQHVLSGETLNLTAQLLPMGERDPVTVVLRSRGDDGAWSEAARARVVAPGWTATFRVSGWPAHRDVPYRVVYELPTRGGGAREFVFAGTVRRDPRDRQKIVVAAFTGNHNCSHRIGQPRTDWPGVLWFPHQDVVDRVAGHRPDLLFFSGDQIYEGRSPTFPDRANIHLDYMYKWYLWCWAYRDLTRDTPCVTIPDDHDVFQGNVWGEGGRKAQRDVLGGYVHPADFVQMVERTQTSHLPRSSDPAPVEQGIGVYFTAFNYGRIGFAVIEDRKFKSGCGGGRLPPTGTRRADHVRDASVDTSKLDVPGLSLLGDRQLRFLKSWGEDWAGHDMKVALSQTVFGGMATHHGAGLARLRADLDSNGWPQSGRNRALRALRRCFAFHVAGDQHLATIVHHGIDDWRDSIWSFAVPSIANFYPRKWMPEAEGGARPAGAPGWMGDHLDGLGNRVTVWAASNPGPQSGHEPADLHDRMPGYGIVRLDRRARTVTMECWPRYAQPGRDAQYPGWPRTIHQLDAYRRKPAGFLPELQLVRMTDPVVHVVDEPTGEVVYALRVSGRTFRPFVFDLGSTYAVHVGEPGTSQWRTLPGLQASVEKQGKITVDL